MKNVLISLAALAVLSTAALANDRGYDLRDSDTYFGQYSTQSKNTGYESNALAVAGDSASLTAFERMQKISEENEHGSK